mgnify:FL=1|tara:strand:+ start:1615 stop:2718 length:1104 start_codon:yes stop_codon:yes gene_type:complete
MSISLTLEEKIKLKLEEKVRQNSLRTLNLKIKGIDFSSNDYLGFAKKKIFLNEQIGSTGSRLISGNSSYHLKLEKKIAKFHNSESCLIFNSGYLANLGIISSILNRNDTIIYDQFIHASSRDGIRLSNSKSFSFKHNDIDSLNNKLKQAKGNIIILIESVYSMNGSICDLEKIVELSKKFNANIILDEAHATGVIGEKGKGLAVKLNLESEIFARIHTFGKSLGCCGAAILGTKSLISYLINFAYPFIYTTSLPKVSIKMIDNAYKLLKNSKNEISKLKSNIELFKKTAKNYNVNFIPSNTPIQSIIIPNIDLLKLISKKMNKLGFRLYPILHPTVERGKERIRICLHSYNTHEEIESLIVGLKKLL